MKSESSNTLSYLIILTTIRVNMVTLLGAADAAKVKKNGESDEKKIW